MVKFAAVEQEKAQQSEAFKADMQKMREEMAQHKQQDKESYDELAGELTKARECLAEKEEVYKRLL